MMKNISRRDFLKGAVASAASVAAAGALGTFAGASEAETEAVAEEAVSTSGNPEWLGDAPVIEESEISETWDTDLLIVGAGNGGMVAAAKAADLGLDFRIIEQMSIVGDSRDFFGAIDSKYTEAAGCKVDRAKLLGEISRYASGKCDQRVVKVWIDESADMIDYIGGILDQYGFDIVFEPDTGVETSGTDYYCCPQQHTASAREDSEYADLGRNAILQDYIEKKGYAIDFGISLVELTKDGEKVSGVIAQNTNTKEYIRINAKNVILATGGYAGNPEMMMALNPLASKVTTAAFYYMPNKGQGLKAAMWAGAAKDTEPAAMVFDRGAVAPGVDAGYVLNENGTYELPGGAITTMTEYNPGSQPFLKVSRDGDRFANESCPYNDILFAASHLKGRVYAQIYDANFKDDWQRFHTLGCSSVSRLVPDIMGELIEGKVEEGIVCKADTLDELADQLGFEGEAKETFLATCERYNELYDAQEDTDFGKAAYRLSELRTAPFYGVWLGGNLLTTGDGITINPKMQALDADQNVIEGLYCIGDVSGSFFANNYPELLPGTACGRTMTFAIKAVKTIAGV
jgi:hypothetical protein